MATSKLENVGVAIVAPGGWVVVIAVLSSMRQLFYCHHRQRTSG